MERPIGGEPAKTWMAYIASLESRIAYLEATLKSVENGYRCTFEGNKSLIDELRDQVAELERENVILTTQRDEYRECCSALDCHGTKGVTDGWVCVPECEWEQAFRPLNLF